MCNNNLSCGKSMHLYTYIQCIIFMYPAYWLSFWWTCFVHHLWVFSWRQYIISFVSTVLWNNCAGSYEIHWCRFTKESILIDEQQFNTSIHVAEPEDCKRHQWSATMYQCMTSYPLYVHGSNYWSPPIYNQNGYYMINQLVSEEMLQSIKIVPQDRFARSNEVTFTMNLIFFILSWSPSLYALCYSLMFNFLCFTFK